MVSVTLLLASGITQLGAFDAGPTPMLMQHPTVNQTSIVFSFAGDLWKVPRAGGQAIRLTASVGRETNPFFSPDGNWIAFSGQLDGNVDVYVMPAEGGAPRRLTAHPGGDEVQGWTPDGKSVLFQSSMYSPTSYTQLFTVPVTGGFPKMLPFPAADEGSYSPDGQQLAYVPNGKWQQAWKRYRGGQTTPIWIAQISDSKWKAVPRKNTNDETPMWIGNSIYYRSDPDGIVGLYRYDISSGKITTEVKPSGFDIKSATAGPGVIAYEKLGNIFLFDLATKQSSRVPITINADFPEARTQFKDVSKRITGYALAPKAQRLAVTARGFVWTIPAEKGDPRLLSDAQGVNRHDPAWSPDGKYIAFITDQRGTQELALADQSNNQEKLFSLGGSPGVYRALKWSPDAKKIAYLDEKLSLWILDIDTGKNTKVDTGTRRQGTSLEAHWSPDSKWITYTKDLITHFQAIFVYNVAENKVSQVTDGMAFADSPSFDRSGKYLYFMASTDIGEGLDSQNMSSFAYVNNTSSIYCIVLRKDDENPLHPESDEEPIRTGKKPEKPENDEAEPKGETKIDFDGLEERIIALPMDRQIYSGLEAGPAGTLFVIAQSPRATAVDGPSGPPELLKFSFEDREANTFAAGASGFEITPDGSKMLLMAGGGPSIVSTNAPTGKGQPIKIGGLRVKIDPLVEWKAIFEDAVRNQMMLFYAPNMHGLEFQKVADRYRPFLPHLKSRADLNYLFNDLMGEICVGHMFIGGGDIPGVGGGISVGMLGADFTFENGRYKIARVYNGERWNPDLYAPLAQPGINAKAGEFLLAIDGVELKDSMDLYLAMENKAGKQVKVKLGANADGRGSREVTVVPVPFEGELRQNAWIEDNRRRVWEATNGRVGYAHIPDTGGGGWQAFQRYFYAQAGKDGFIVDERHNSGGSVNDFMVRELTKPLDFFSATRYGANWYIPNTGIYGPKVMIANEMAGSGGDIFPYIFKQYKAGKLVGKRTWGAMITNYGFSVVDGGRISSPDDAMFNVKTGQWIIENEGTPPDIEVELDPYLWRQGKDAQLEKAIEVILKDLENYKPIRPKTPPYPEWSKQPTGP